MIVEPYKLRPVPPQVALLTAEGQTIAEDGSALSLDAIPKGWQVWSSSERVLALVREGRGRALCWRGQPIRYAPAEAPSEFRVRVLSLPTPDDEATLDGLKLWRDWLGAYGASPAGSLGSSSFSLLRATLREPLWTSVPFAAAPPLHFTLGGRQELGPRGAPAEYAGTIRHFDMRAAYAARLGTLEYGGHWHEIHAGSLHAHVDTLAAANKMIFCRARVTLSGRHPGPLVRRPRTEPPSVAWWAEYPRSGRLQGVWTLQELHAAEAHGARVTLLEGWFHSNAGRRPFEPWWGVIEEGRRMEGFAGLLAKATGNALWGQFCISSQGKRQILSYRRGRSHVVELPLKGGRRPAHDLSEYLTGSVRADLYRFCASAGDRLCSAHTDGGWVDCSDGFDYPDWRVKAQASRLRVLDPQKLAYLGLGEVAERYVVAGWPADGAGELFERDWQERARAAA